MLFVSTVFRTIVGVKASCGLGSRDDWLFGLAGVGCWIIVAGLFYRGIVVEIKVRIGLQQY